MPTQINDPVVTEYGSPGRVSWVRYDGKRATVIRRMGRSSYRTVASSEATDTLRAASADEIQEINRLVPMLMVTKRG